ncbi:MAG: membrane protein of unknown function [Promethearchaeota archaeon]|nr:MAG: membrane protein of unknown function [Candidatus Lokiarchaeota archaeon]
MKIDKKQKYFLFLLGFSILFFTLWIILFYSYWDLLTLAFNLSNDFIILFWFLILRISFFGIFSAYFFYKWFIQEVIYPSDAHFLFGLFFYIMMMGKINDIFIYNAIPPGVISEEIIFVFMQIRYFLMTIAAFPLLYIGLEALFMILGIYSRDITRKKINRLRFTVIFLLTLFVTILILLSPNYTFLIDAPIYPLLTGLAMLGIVVMFIYMYKKERLSQAHGFIVGIGFLLLIITSIASQFLIATTEEFFVLLTEILSAVVYVIILIGFLKKPKFAEQKNT